MKYSPVFAAMCLFLSGCTHPHVAAAPGIDMVVPLSAVTSDITLKNCKGADLNKCGSAIFSYKKGSEQYRVVR